MKRYRVEFMMDGSYAVVNMVARSMLEAIVQCLGLFPRAEIVLAYIVVEGPLAD